MEPKRGIGWSIGLFVLALLTGSVASRGVFSLIPLVLSKSPIVNEVLVDLTGVTASLLATGASILAYNFRDKLIFRIYLTLTILFALAFAYEFLVGFLWLALDHFKPFGQSR